MQHPDISLELFVIFNAIAAVFANAFPILWAFLSPWHTTRLGKALMLQGVSLAVALDTTLLFAVLDESTVVRRSFYIVVFLFLAVSCGYITFKMLKHNYVLPMKRMGAPLWKPWLHVTPERLNND